MLCVYLLMINGVVRTLTQSFLFRGRTRATGRQRLARGKRIQGRKGERIVLWVDFGRGMTQQLPKTSANIPFRLKVMSINHNFSVTFSLLQGDQGLPGPRGQPGEPGGPGGNVCCL